MANENIIQSAVGDIHVPGKGIDNTPIDTSIEINPQNPFTMDISPKIGEDSAIAYPGFELEHEKVGEVKSFINEFKQSSSIYHELHATSRPLTEPASPQVVQYYPDVNDKFYHPAPPGWSPKQEIDKLSDNVDSKFLPALLKTKSPEDFRWTMDSINEQSTRDRELENGSFAGKLGGGIAGFTIGSLENMIPYAAIATKAKVAAGFLSTFAKSAPGVLGASAIHEGAAQMDKVDGNLPDFIKDTFIDTAFGMAFFGAVGVGKTLLNVSEMNRLKQFARESLDGIGFNFKVDKKGNHVGFEAIDTTGGSISAAKVTKAQELADAAFYKGGLYKIPVIGQATADILTGNLGNLPIVKDIDWMRKSFNYLFGSPLVQLKINSDYPEAGAFADAAFDHSITTVGEVKGGSRPDSFELKVKQTRAMLTAARAQMSAFHATANGYSLENRPAITLANAWGAVKQKTIETLSQESKSTNHMNEEDFMDKAQRVMIGQTDNNAGVNDCAAMYRKIVDNAAHEYLSAYKLPKDYFRNMETYLSRVYNTPHMLENEGIVGGNHEANPSAWIPVISKYFADSDVFIAQKMQPIRDLENQIDEFKSSYKEAFAELGRRELQMHPVREIIYPQEQGLGIRNYVGPIKKGSKKRLVEGIRETPLTSRTDIIETYNDMSHRLTVMKEKLQNELRENPALDYHVEDRNALSANEAKELKALLVPSDKLQKEIEEQQKVISKLKTKSSGKLATAQKQGTVEKAKPHAQEYIEQKEIIDAEEAKLNDLKNKLTDEEYNLNDKARHGEINPRLYNPLNFKFRDPNNRLRFRDVFGSQLEREIHAKACYDSIMNMRPEDVISDIFGHITGNEAANPLKKRTLLIPDEILYNNNFMSKDLHAKVANYVNFLSKRTHLKTSFQYVTVNGDFEELAEGISIRYQSRRDVINKKIETLSDPKEIAKQNKLLRKEAIKFGELKKTMRTLFETRMMGINKRNDFDVMARRTWMALSAATNLHNLPATQITDLAFAGFQHGIWPSIRDGIYPIIESIGGILKTKDAEALREMAPHINLGYQDMLNNYADRNWNSELQPHINMGKFVSGVEKYAHFSALTDLTPYIDNGIQRANGSIIQSRFMELLHHEVEGRLSEKNALYLRKYGIDPKVWASRMVKAYKDSQGFKTKLGGYMSKSWEWQDLEAANLFNNSVFKGIQNTLVFKGMADSPFFADNIIGMFFHTFTGWTYAATNRYLIPALQHADGEMLIKMMWMLGAGSLVSPMRRLSRGEDAWPDDMTPTQHAYEAFSDSGVVSTFGNVLNMANLMSDNKLLGDLKNDKFSTRMRTGIFGMSDVISGTANKISAVLGQVNSGMNEKDMKTAAKMTAITGAMYGHYLSDKLIESWNLPRNKREAEFNNS